MINPFTTLTLPQLTEAIKLEQDSWTNLQKQVNYSAYSKEQPLKEDLDKEFERRLHIITSFKETL